MTAAAAMPPTIRPVWESAFLWPTSPAATVFEAAT